VVTLTTQQEQSAMQSQAVTVSLSQDELEDLQRTLTIHADAAGPNRSALTGSVIARDTPSVIPDILASYRQGVTIAPQAESRPLLPLFAAAAAPIPPAIKVDHDQLNYDFYSVEIAFSVLLPPGQFPLNAELALCLSDDVPDLARRVRPIQLFPDRKDVTLFRADIEAGVGIDAAMRLQLPTTVYGLPLPFSELSADAKFKAGLVVGPFSFPICKAQVEVTGLQDQDIFWRYNLDSALAGANTFKSVLILKVAREARRVSCAGSLRVTPYKPAWLLFKEKLPTLKASAQLAIELAA
jgi:hypothetical protein